MTSSLWKIDQTQCQAKANLEKGAVHAIPTLRSKPIWRMSTQAVDKKLGKNWDFIQYFAKICAKMGRSALGYQVHHPLPLLTNLGN
jgi:hypothetical protein